jgi:hypothetical protein
LLKGICYTCLFLDKHTVDKYISGSESSQIQMCAKNRLTLLLVYPDFSTCSRITCYFRTPQHNDNTRVVCAAGLWVKCHESRSLDRNRKLARELLTTRLDNHLNGELSVENQERMHKKLLQDRRREETRYRRLLGSSSTVFLALSPRALLYWKITTQERKRQITRNVTGHEHFFIKLWAIW